MKFTETPKRILVFWKSILTVVIPLAFLPLVFNPAETDSDKQKSKCAYGKSQVVKINCFLESRENNQTRVFI